MGSKADPINVIIVGGGLGGLGCAIACRRQGMNVTVFDQVKEFSRIGDSIGFGSNSARLLYRWGLAPRMEPISSSATEITIHNFDSPEVLTVDPQVGECEEKYGFRSLIGHRGDFHLLFADFAREIGVKIHMNTAVDKYDIWKPSVTLSSGEELSCDVVICAEGVKSKGREAVLGYVDKPLHSGYAIWRGFMSGDLIRDDPVAGHYLKGGDSIHLYIGPDVHGFVSTLRGGKEINAVLTHKDTGNVDEGWTLPGKKEDVLKVLKGWSPDMVRVWEVMPECLDWKLVYRPCLEKWVADSGLVTLMGDAAHPFLPTSTQGASQAIEDGATIACCLAKAGKGNIPLALNTYFEIRHDYVAAAQATGIEQREKWHNIHDPDSKTFKDSFDISSVSQGNYYLWENDAEKTVEDNWEAVSEKVKARLAKV